MEIRSIWEMMYSGMGVAGWVIGFLMALGVALVVLGGIGYGVLALLRSDDGGKGGEADDGSGHPVAGRHAARVGGNDGPRP